MIIALLKLINRHMARLGAVLLWMFREACFIIIIAKQECFLGGIRSRFAAIVRGPRFQSWMRVTPVGRTPGWLQELRRGSWLCFTQPWSWCDWGIWFPKENQQQKGIRKKPTKIPNSLNFSSLDSFQAQIWQRENSEGTQMNIINLELTESLRCLEWREKSKLPQ